MDSYYIIKAANELRSAKIFIFVHFCLCCVVITPPLPLDEGTARTAIQVHAANLIEIRLGERWQLISNQS